jgi:hypothetical protein
MTNQKDEQTDKPAATFHKFRAYIVFKIKIWKIKQV